MTKLTCPICNSVLECDFSEREDYFLMEEKFHCSNCNKYIYAFEHGIVLEFIGKKEFWTSYDAGYEYSEKDKKKRKFEILKQKLLNILR
jgi:uncharacterized protein YbaR (Trm112 family)